MVANSNQSQSALHLYSTRLNNVQTGEFIVIPSRIPKVKYPDTLQIVITAVLALTSAAHIDRDAHITEQRSEVNHDGTYSNSFQTSNGIAYTETGLGGHVSNGASRYYDPQGQLHELTWTADENGYRPAGKDVPVPPAIPSYILRALEYIRTHPPKDQQQQQAGRFF